MAQNSIVEIPASHYTRADFTALRAHLNRIPLERIADLYYTEDDRELLRLPDGAALRRRLDDLRDELVQRATDANPHVATSLRDARSSARWSKTAIDFLVQAADRKASAPRRSDPVSMWFRSHIARALKNEGVHILADLLGLINGRGNVWWRPIPRLGAGKAAAIVAWLQRNSESLGQIEAVALLPISVSVRSDMIVLSPDDPVLVPFERIKLPSQLSGSNGINRNTTFCLIQACNDYEAIECYLFKFRAQEKTLRAYQKELERFLLWCIIERRRPMSSVLVEDCEAYKDFLSSPTEHWIGPKALRLGPKWRPFTGSPSEQSQRYAIQSIRTFFAWLVNVRYLLGNPWIVVSDPRVAKPLTSIQIQKALPGALWCKLIDVLDTLCNEPDDSLCARYRLRGVAATMSMSGQFRLARAALLLLGDGGLRREEAANASRKNLRPTQSASDLWELDVLGKRYKWRTTFLPTRAIDAIEAHWRDRHQDFSFGMQDVPLLAPLVVPPTIAALNRQALHNGHGFTPDGIYQVVRATLDRICADPTIDLEAWERQILKRAGPHAFRHTFGTTAAAGEVPIDVLQKAFGHASIQTTTIYIQAEKQRSVDELGKFFRQERPKT